MVLLRLLLPLIIILLVAMVVLRIVRAVKNKRKPARQNTPPPRLSTPFDRLSPQQAAVIMMIALARETGSISELQRAIIFANMKEYFQLEGEDAEALYYRGMEVYARTKDIAHTLDWLCPVVNENCSYTEKKQLQTMMQNIATADGTVIAENQKHALQLLERKLKL